MKKLLILASLVAIQAVSPLAERAQEEQRVLYKAHPSLDFGERVQEEALEIVWVGNVVTSTRPLPYKTLVEWNPELEKGEVRVLEEGQEGIEVTYHTFKVNPFTGALYTPIAHREITFAPLDEVIELGSRNTPSFLE